MRKLLSFISLICVLNVLTIGGLAGYLWGTGRLDKNKAQTISDMLKQQGTPEKFREKVFDLLAPVAATSPATSTAPATGPALSQSEFLEPATAAERIEFARNMREEQRLRLEGEVQGLRSGQELLARKLTDVEGREEKLTSDRQAFEKMTVAASSQKDNAGFEKTMALLQELKPKQVKDLLTAMAPEEVVKYLAAMEPDQAAKIIAEFKTPAEKTTVADVLQQIRTGKPPAPVPDAAAAASAGPDSKAGGVSQSAAASPAFTVREAP